MKIAFISYEYPPDTAVGGIATYVQQAAQMLVQRGHQVEVFAGSDTQTSSQLVDGIWVHRVQAPRSCFAGAIAPVFVERHGSIQFDVLEGPDCGADAAAAVRSVPDIPLVLKLHTPGYILAALGKEPLSWPSKLRMAAGAIRRGKWLKRPAPYDPAADPERHHALTADEIAAPSLAIAQRLIIDWGLAADRVSHVPYPYIPAPALLAIPIETHTHTVTFVGRLERRKGVLDLAAAIPHVLRHHPQVRFRFVGPAWNSPHPQMDMQQYLETKLAPYRQTLEFTGAVPLHQIPDHLTTDICVFPSIWESYGLVCVEAMAAGRGIVASAAGGMAELLDQGQFGRLVPPQDPRQLAIAIIDLLDHPAERMRLGQAARDRVLATYNLKRIGDLQEASYRRAIAHRQALGPRPVSANAQSMTTCGGVRPRWGRTPQENNFV
ncbi:MAG: glycosyltransferase family 4 protein [Synechococcales bacterium]|nr:glycosyltransferase family 4 protein [Synechococcales bacterium]